MKMIEAKECDMRKGHEGTNKMCERREGSYQLPVPVCNNTVCTGVPVFVFCMGFWGTVCTGS